MLPIYRFPGACDPFVFYIVTINSALFYQTFFTGLGVGLGVTVGLGFAVGFGVIVGLGTIVVSSSGVKAADCAALMLTPPVPSIRVNAHTAKPSFQGTNLLFFFILIFPSYPLQNCPDILVLLSIFIKQLYYILPVISIKTVLILYNYHLDEKAV